MSVAKKSTGKKGNAPQGVSEEEKTILSDAENKSFKRVYLIFGEEDFLKQFYKKRLLGALVLPGDELNYARFKGDDMTEDEVISFSDTMPFLSDYRTVLVLDSGLFAVGKGDSMADFVGGNLPDTTVMIFVESAVDKRSRLYKAVTKVGLAAEVNRKNEEYQKTCVVRAFARVNKKMRDINISYLLDRTGPDLANLANEMDKLIAYAYDREEITKEDIDAVVIAHTKDHIFEMINACTERQASKALRYYHELLAERESPVKIIRMMGTQYHQILMVKEMRSKGILEGEIAGKIGIREFAVRMRVKLASQYTKRELLDAVDLCLAAEDSFKEGLMGDRLSAETLIVKLSQRGEQG